MDFQVNLIPIVLAWAVTVGASNRSVIFKVAFFPLAVVAVMVAVPDASRLIFPV